MIYSIDDCHILPFVIFLMISCQDFWQIFLRFCWLESFSKWFPPCFVNFFGPITQII